jgi:hypothetical protein
MGKRDLTWSCSTFQELILINCGLHRLTPWRLPLLGMISLSHRKRHCQEYYNGYPVVAAGQKWATGYTIVSGHPSIDGKRSSEGRAAARPPTAVTFLSVRNCDFSIRERRASSDPPEASDYQRRAGARSRVLGHSEGFPPSGETPSTPDQD